MQLPNETGEKGERIAEEFLIEKGWVIYERNWKGFGGELDLVAKDPEGETVIVEVKTMVGIDGGIEPEDHMTMRKMQKIRSVAEGYINSPRSPKGGGGGWRIDCITVRIPQNKREEGALTECMKHCEIKHYENI